MHSQGLHTSVTYPILGSKDGKRVHNCLELVSVFVIVLHHKTDSFTTSQVVEQYKTRATIKPAAHKTMLQPTS